MKADTFHSLQKAFVEWWDHSQDDPAIAAVIRDFQAKKACLARKAFLAGYAAGKREKDGARVPPPEAQGGIRNKIRGESKKRILRPKDVSEIFGIPEGTLANMRYHKEGPKYYKYPGGRGVFYLLGEVEDWLLSSPVLTVSSL